MILFVATGHKKKGGGLAGAGERFSMSHCMSVTSFLMENEAIINYFLDVRENKIFTMWAHCLQWEGRDDT